ncbi:MAG TPA: hypothetical protein VEQ15_14835 [Myxococcales bacterium]|nr:hypothetical protein [Myxococcales bacterium]
MAATSTKARSGRGTLRAGPDRRARAERLLSLFAWHRDAPLVARSLGLSLDELYAELDDLKLRRKAYRLTRGSEFDLPIARAVPGVPSGPPVRRRARSARTQSAAAAEREAAPAESDPRAMSAAAGAAPRGEGARGGAVADQAAELLAVLAKVGPRRGALAARLGAPRHPLSERVLLARFRAAGLERELGQRERDLLRGLFARHRGAARAVAAELGLEPQPLQRLLRERGLSGEIESLRDRFRTEARARRWPREQIEQLVRRRAWLDDLGIAAELEGEVLSRARPAWERSGGSVARLRRELRVSESDARALQALLAR